MAVMEMTRARHHNFGLAMGRIMKSPNVAAMSQEHFADMISESGFIVYQQTISDYMRNRHVLDKQSQSYVDEPRSIPSMDFIVAVINRFDLTAAEREDFVSNWLSILPQERKKTLFSICETLIESGTTSGSAHREIKEFEADRAERESSEGDFNQQAGDRKT